MLLKAQLNKIHGFDSIDSGVSLEIALLDDALGGRRCEAVIVDD